MGDLTRRALLGSSAALAVAALVPLPKASTAVAVVEPTFDEFLTARMAEKIKAFAEEHENRLLYGVDLSSTPDEFAVSELRVMPCMQGVIVSRVWRDGQLVFDRG